MRMVNQSLEISLELEENIVHVVCVEHTKMFTEVVGDLWNQMSGENGSWILSDGEKEKNIGKEVLMVVNPFEISCNNKKIITRLYQELEDIAREDYFVELTELNQKIISLLDGIVQKTSYHIEFDYELTVSDLLKSYHTKIEESTGSLLERIVDYIKMSHQVLKQQVMVFVNLKDYLTEDELVLLYAACFYEKVFLILLEGKYKNRVKHEKCLIIDSDLCIIQTDELTAHRQCDSSVRTSFEV